MTYHHHHHHHHHQLTVQKYSVQIRLFIYQGNQLHV